MIIDTITNIETDTSAIYFRLLQLPSDNHYNFDRPNNARLHLRLTRARIFAEK